VTDGRILGHEAVGTVEAVGAGVKTVKVGDRVLVSCITSCGVCRFCRESRYGQCVGGGGWILGHKIDGTQAEYVRVPFADTSTYQVPPGVTDEQILMLADILPTGYEVGVLNVTITTGLVDTYTTPTLLRLVISQQLDAARFVTHHFTLDQFEEAYDVFARAGDTGALKVVLTRT
jgi:threonine dehydrogenase-like Zn-dependent dehydrogenase